MSDFTVRVRSERQNLRDRIKWLEEGLNKLINHYSYTTVPKEVRNIAQSYLDGEPTTADEYNESQQLEGIELKQELESEYDSDMDEVNAEIAEYDRKYWGEEE